MITRRNFLTRAAVGVAAVLGFAAAHKTEQSSAQGNPEPIQPVKPQRAEAAHRVEAKVGTVKPQPWTARTYRYRATRDITLYEGDVLTDHLLRRKGLVPVDDSMRLDVLLNMPIRLKLKANDTVDFKLNRSALNSINATITPDIWGDLNSGEIAFWMKVE